MSDNAGVILLVEDEKLTQIVTQRVLTGLGFKVYVAGSALEALTMFDEHDFDLIFMDIGLPGKLDGVDVTRQIRHSGERGSTIPIIAMTAHAHETDVARFYAAQMDEVIVKPVQLDNLKKIISRFLKQAVF